MMIPEAVAWFFRSVLTGLQIHGQHDGCMAALVHLAFQIYEALVRKCRGKNFSFSLCLLPSLRISGDASPLNQPLWPDLDLGGRLLISQGLCVGFVLVTVLVHYLLCYLKRPRYAELKAVMEQIPEIQKDSLEQFDSKLLNVTLQKVTDKRRKDHFKRLIAGCIGVGCGIKQHRNSSLSYLQGKKWNHVVGFIY